MQFATEFWNGRAIVKMICKYGEAVLVVGLGETPSFADERALRRSVDTFMWAPETCCQIRPGARSLGNFSRRSRRYMIHCVMGHLLWSKGGG